VKVLERWKSWIDTSDMIVAHWLRAAREALLGEMPVLAAGTALFAIIATVPLIAAVVSIWSLVADPSEIQGHLRSLSTVLPPGLIAFLRDQLVEQTQRSSSTVGIALAASVFVAVASARGAARALIDALNRAYRVRERRRPVQRFLITLAMAAGTMIGLIVLFGVTVALPSMMALMHLTGYGLVGVIRWPILMTVVFGALLALYRFAPSPRELGTERHLWPGALIGTLVLILVSVGLSQYVERVARYDVVYGAFGGVVVVLLWFYLSVIALVVGGFVNAELERHAGAPAPDRSMY
jgi:membrane protein